MHQYDDDAPDPPEGWGHMRTAPTDGTPVDLLFDPSTADRDARGSLAEFYSPGCTRKRGPAEPVVRTCRFANGYFRPFIPECPEVRMHAILGVRLTGWRPALP